jgi:hypothetical protein
MEYYKWNITNIKKFNKKKRKKDFAPPPPLGGANEK